MRRFWIFAKNPEKVPEVRRIAESMGFVHDEEQADFIVSLGGDGTFLICERKFPGVPKLLVRDSLICFKCHDEPLEEMLEIIHRGDSRVHELMKLEATGADGRLLAANDVVVRNADPRHALRFTVDVNGERVDETLIGDGVVVATPFGSTGYYHSVARETFGEGIAVGFNNLTEAREPLHLDADAEVELSIVRSEADLTADNHPRIVQLSEEDSVRIRRAPEVTRMLGH